MTDELFFGDVTGARVLARAGEEVEPEAPDDWVVVNEAEPELEPAARAANPPADLGVPGETDTALVQAPFNVLRLPSFLQFLQKLLREVWVFQPLLGTRDRAAIILWCASVWELVQRGVWCDPASIVVGVFF